MDQVVSERATVNRQQVLQSNKALAMSSFDRMEL